MGPITRSSRMGVTDPAQVRCSCGRLLARWVPDGIQVKCKRCRKIVTIPLTKIEGAPPGGGTPLTRVPP